jgi:predicted transcriptional regulator
MGVLRCRISDEHCEQFRSLAAANQRTPSELLRAMVESVLKTAPAPVSPTEPERQGRKSRVMVRLRPDVFERVQALAESEKRPPSQWVAALVGARVGVSLPFADADLKALRDATNELARVGRNLNTVLHVLHRSGRGDASSVPVKELHEAVRQVMYEVMAVREKALSRHGQGDDES